MTTEQPSHEESTCGLDCTVLGSLGLQEQALVIIAGPCSIESESQVRETAAAVKEHGGHILRGGAFKPRTSPYSFQGLGEKALKWMARAAEDYQLLTITEVMDRESIELVAAYADIMQVGTRNMFNYSLLKKLGSIDKPILLKRSFMATIEEFLLAAEYIVMGGNEKIMLCERGIRTFVKYTRNTLDLSAVPIITKMKGWPVIVDPCHAAGRSDIIIPLCRAAIAVGCHGLMLEVHPNPKKALSDGMQSLDFAQFSKAMDSIKRTIHYMQQENACAETPSSD